MGLFQKFKDGLQKTHSQLVHEIKRIVTLSPKLTGSTLEELEAALLGADLGTAMTQQILAEVKKAYETQGRSGSAIFEIAQREVGRSLFSGQSELRKQPGGVTVVSIVGVNGTGKTTTSAKLANLIQSRGQSVVLAACDTFRAAAIEQLKLWGQKLNVPVVAGAYHADPAAVAHDAIAAAQSRNTDFLLVDTAGRLHTKQNLMQELQKCIA
jgi:fused signal recognition particle receptor